MDLPPAPAEGDPLAHPSAARVFGVLVDAGAPATVASIAARCRLHPNSVRVHLRRLRDAGLADVSLDDPSGPGRPRQLWRVAGGAEPAGVPPVGYSDLAGWLSSALSPEQARRHGRRIGADRAGGRIEEREAGECAAVLDASFAAMGFRPRRRDRGPRTGFTLCNCPYRDVALANPGVVCALHRGIAEGMVETMDPGSRVTRFEARNPVEAGCVVEVERAEKGREAVQQ